MAVPFRGIVNVDIRDSVPDWGPYEQPKAAPGSPNVLYIVLDDVGFGALGCYGGPIETPNIDRIAANGLRYGQWHTTALCSPTRSCLLTGRNHTTNGMACISEAAVGFPGANGHIPPECATLAEILVEQGFSTAMVGKWHLCAEDEMNLASTKRNWPIGRGFERFYGFLGAETSQWYPDLVHDNHPVEQPATPEEGYHFGVDITDRALEYFGDVKAIAPDRPVFLYYAPGCAHAPHQAPKEWTDRYRGRFDAGYEAMRAEILARQKEMGLIPPGTELPALNPIGGPETRSGPEGKPFPLMDYTRPWESLSGDEKRLFARMAEVYAGFVSHCDDQIGRLLAYLEEIEQLDNTIIVLVSDNGASGEGGPNGSVNENKLFNGVPDDLAENLSLLDDLGTTRTYNHYPNGWAMAFNAPFKMWKRYSFNGGTCDPCIISWPAGITARGEIRDQYHHATDVVPTLLDCLGIELPDTVKGYTQHPIQGVSMRYSFDAAAIPTAKHTQFYSMLGTRGIWHDGWKAVTTHPAISGWSHFPEDAWELYHTETDRSELHDRAAEEPGRLAELVGLWFHEAGANQALPLDDRLPIEILLTPRPQLTPPRNRYVYRPGGAEVPESVAVSVRNRSYSIGALVDIPGPGAAGVLFSHGGRFGGHALYVKDNRLHYVYNFLGSEQQLIRADEELPTGENLILAASFDKDGEDPPGHAHGVLSLYYGDRKVAEGRIHTQAGKFGIGGEGLNAGHDAGEPVTDDYPGTAPWAFTGGTLNRVAVDVSGEPFVDLEREAAAMLSRE
ncbi:MULTISPECIES: arylsulfatase [Rhodococcus]|jgi:arylsulfatase|uniref:Arylsulfatase n=1 Tax=Rhodococcus opacus TaxID=37919 RepID=A0AAX3Y5S6_RHOOP|nr:MULTISPECIES: arylsulfatase [Rhodococcus]MBA8963806.1 arylsulfatase [Rhodococcus opacus]MBP2207298.1 arylsulfatase [Rhodococcus opacus]MCZ4588302.1 arylsulfatase [Rhodococcus opacus]MDI9938679.1 arylsulfatase [Rhodococcus sp. IEGM 1351]MDX5965232.1 arylsulfatase [Rhodococcus opacus]